MVRRIRKLLGRQAIAHRGGQSFRKRYDNIERARVEMLRRLANIDDRARAHPSFKRASILLNQSFRKASLSQRPAILAAAEWTIDLLESLTIML